MKINKIALIALLSTGVSLGATPHKKYVTTDYNKWGISAYIFSMNDKLLQNFKDIKLGYKLQATYHITKNIYTKSHIAMFNHGKFGFGASVGIEQRVGMFQPYAEAGYSTSYNIKDHENKSISYDAGTNIRITRKFSTYVEFDNFISKGKEAFSTGINYSIHPNLGVGADVQFSAETKNNNADIFVSYSF